MLLAARRAGQRGRRPDDDGGHQLAAVLGIGTGAVLVVVAQLVEPQRVGAVTGLVGAAGGLGGYVLLALTATALRRRVIAAP